MAWTVSFWEGWASIPLSKQELLFYKRQDAVVFPCVQKYHYRHILIPSHGLLPVFCSSVFVLAAGSFHSRKSWHCFCRSFPCCSSCFIDLNAQLEDLLIAAKPSNGLDFSMELTQNPQTLHQSHLHFIINNTFIFIRASTDSKAKGALVFVCHAAQHRYSSRLPKLYLTLPHLTCDQNLHPRPYQLIPAKRYAIHPESLSMLELTSSQLWTSSLPLHPQFEKLSATSLFSPVQAEK